MVRQYDLVIYLPKNKRCIVRDITGNMHLLQALDSLEPDFWAHSSDIKVIMSSMDERNFIEDQLSTFDEIINELDKLEKNYESR